VLLGFPNRGWLGKAGRRLALQMTSLGFIGFTFGKDYRKPSFFLTKYKGFLQLSLQPSLRYFASGLWLRLNHGMRLHVDFATRNWRFGRETGWSVQIKYGQISMATKMNCLHCRLIQIISGWSMFIPCKAYIWSPGFGGFLSTTLLRWVWIKTAKHTHFECWTIMQQLSIVRIWPIPKITASPPILLSSHVKIGGTHHANIKTSSDPWDDEHQKEGGFKWQV
jgi:hypothetical protein